MSQPKRLSLVVALATLFAITSFSPALLSQIRVGGRIPGDGSVPIAPTPSDPYELVTGNISVLTEPADRVAAMKLVRNAAKNGITHNADMDPFDFQVNFNATGNLNYVGSGQLTETWLSGQSWRVTMSLGNYSMVRYGYSGKVGDQTPVTMIPMRAEMLRNEVLWAIGNLSGGMPSSVRTAPAQLNGQALTCVLLSSASGAVTQTQSRLWIESEFCVSNATGLIQVHSPAPGTYTMFGYGKNLQFHGKSMPDHFTTYVNAVQVITADMTIKDPTATPYQLKPTPEMLAAGRTGVYLSDPAFVPINVPAPASAHAIQSATVRLAFDNQGQVTDTEVSAVSDPGIVSAALAAAKQFKMRGPNDVYLTIRFVPTAE